MIDYNVYIAAVELDDSADIKRATARRVRHQTGDPLMSASEATNIPIETRFRDLTPGSMTRAVRAREVFPSGVVHDARRMWPCPLYMERAKGAHKWDVDGNRYLFFTEPSRTGVDPTDFDASMWTLEDIKACAQQQAVSKFRLALLSNGVDISGKPGGIVSGVHSAEDVERTADATRAALRALRAEGEVH